MFERRHEPLLPRRVFLARVVRSVAAAGCLIFGSLVLGMVGYHVFAGLGWIDSMLNASMILTGMGPANPMTTTAAKIFATGYALFSGIAFLTSVAILIAPIAHRFLHHFHLELEDETGGREDGR